MHDELHKKNKEIENIIFTFNVNVPSYSNVRFAFDRLIGPLATATVYEEYKEKRKEYIDILSIVLKWSSEYEKTKTLIYIQREELLNVYYKLQELNDELIFTCDSDISDQIVIWLWDLMLLRKKQIEDWNIDNNKI